MPHLSSYSLPVTLAIAALAILVGLLVWYVGGLVGRPGEADAAPTSRIWRVMFPIYTSALIFIAVVLALISFQADRMAVLLDGLSATPGAVERRIEHLAGENERLLARINVLEAGGQSSFVRTEDSGGIKKVMIAVALWVASIFFFGITIYIILLRGLFRRETIISGSVSVASLIGALFAIETINVESLFRLNFAPGELVLRAEFVPPQPTKTPPAVNVWVEAAAPPPPQPVPGRIECSPDHRFGPFRRASVELEAGDPGIHLARILADMEAEAREPVAMLLIGSTDRVPYLPGRGSNDALARERAATVKAWLAAHGELGRVPTMEFDGSVGLVRWSAQQSETASSREVMVCVVWGTPAPGSDGIRTVGPDEAPMDAKAVDPKLEAFLSPGGGTQLGTFVEGAGRQ